MRETPKEFLEQHKYPPGWPPGVSREEVHDLLMQYGLTWDAPLDDIAKVLAFEIEKARNAGIVVAPSPHQREE